MHLLLVASQVRVSTWPEIKFWGRKHRGTFVFVGSCLLFDVDWSLQDIYVISELMETDLASILKSPQPLSDEHCQFFTYQAKWLFMSCVLCLETVVYALFVFLFRFSRFSAASSLYTLPELFIEAGRPLAFVLRVSMSRAIVILFLSVICLSP